MTTLGDASIRVTLDPAAAREEAERFRRELERLDQQRKKVQEEMERAGRGEGAYSYGQPNPNMPWHGQPAPAGQLPPSRDSFPKDSSSDTFADKATTALSMVPKLGLMVMVAKMVKDAVVGAAHTMPVLSKLLTKATDGTVFHEAGRSTDETVQVLAEKVRMMESFVSAASQTKTDLLDYNTALLKLGGKVPGLEGQNQLRKEFYEINYQQELLRRSMDNAVQRNVAGAIGEAVKGAFNK